MSKNIIIIFLVLVVVILSGASVYAATAQHKLFGMDNADNNSISTFWHDGNRCYVARGNGEFRLDPTISVSISCVRYAR